MNNSEIGCMYHCHTRTHRRSYSTRRSLDQLLLLLITASWRRVINKLHRWSENVRSLITRRYLYLVHTHSPAMQASRADTTFGDVIHLKSVIATDMSDITNVYHCVLYWLIRSLVWYLAQRDHSAVLRHGGRPHAYHRQLSLTDFCAELLVPNFPTELTLICICVLTTRAARVRGL